MPKNTIFLATQMEHDQSSYCAGAATIFAGALPRGPHPGDGAASMYAK